MTDHLADAVELLVEAEASIVADLEASWRNDTVENALALVQDATSELRGELRSREPEYPLYDTEAVRLTKREVLG